MNFLVIGYGLIGAIRVRALLELKKETNLINNIYVYDINKPENLEDGVMFADENSFKDKAPDWVFICTPHHIIKDWVRVAASWGSKILVEKPLGRNYQEAKEIYSYLQYPDQLFVGFNYRFYGGIKILCEKILANDFGRIVSINMVLGHGGKPEDIDSWKLNPYDGSPDCLLDPAIHFLDLLNYMFPRRAIPLYGKAWKGFWNTGILEEIHLLLDINGFPVNLQTSLVKWRSTFRIEVNGTNGYAIVDGKGRSYGTQTYTDGHRWGWAINKYGQRDSEREIAIDDCEDSFYLETKCLLEDGAINNCSAIDALDVMKLYDECIKVIK